MRDLLDMWIASAAAHGEESDPEHEVGDLVELVEALFAEMAPAQRRRALEKYGTARELWRNG